MEHVVDQKSVNPPVVSRAHFKLPGCGVGQLVGVNSGRSNETLGFGGFLEMDHVAMLIVILFSEIVHPPVAVFPKTKD